MQVGGEQVGYAEGDGIAGAGGVADLNEAGGGLLGDAECEAGGAAHEYLGWVAVDQNGGQYAGLLDGERAEMVAGELDFAGGQCGGGIDGVDARGGGAADLAEVGDISDPQVQERGYTQSIQAGGYIIEHDAPACGEFFELADREGFGDIEKAEEDESDEGVTPVGVAAEEGDSLAGNFVDDDELRVVAAGLAGDDGRGGDAEKKREGDGGDEREEQGLRSGVSELGAGEPEQDGGDGAPGAGTGLAEAGAEEGGDGPGPEGFVGGGFCTGYGGTRIRGHRFRGTLSI